MQPLYRQRKVSALLKIATYPKFARVHANTAYRTCSKNKNFDGCTSCMSSSPKEYYMPLIWGNISRPVNGENVLGCVAYKNYNYYVYMREITVNSNMGQCSNVLAS